MDHVNPEDDRIRDLLAGARRIVVVGLSPHPQRDSHRVARYLVERGYEIVPVYPREEHILGRRVYRRVEDVPGPIDIVNVFRRSDELPAVVEDVLRAAPQPRALWLQLDCVHEQAARRAREAGLVVVMDRCIMIDHRALLAG